MEPIGQQLTNEGQADKVDARFAAGVCRSELSDCAHCFGTSA